MAESMDMDESTDVSMDVSMDVNMDVNMDMDMSMDVGMDFDLRTQQMNKLTRDADLHFREHKRCVVLNFEL
jgi:hypothetical protein